MKTWQEFVNENGITDIVESLDMGPPSMDGDECLSLRIDYLHPKHGPCSHELYFYIGTWADELWDVQDPHTAMWEATRACVECNLATATRLIEAAP